MPPSNVPVSAQRPVGRRSRIAAFVVLLTSLAATGLTACGHVPAPTSAPPAMAAIPTAAAASGVRFSIIRTARTAARDAFTWQGGSWTRSVVVNHVAVLVDHPRGRFLLDSGLGTRTPAHFEAEMPWWLKPLMRFEGLDPARSQLDARGEPPVSRIILTHAHWDHLAALHDFPEAEVWLPSAEQAHAMAAEPPGVLPAQLGPPAIRWRTYEFDDRRWGPFAGSVDLFGDGTAVLVPLSGHTPGSAGLLLTVASGKRYFFIGDTVWRHDAITQQAPKPPLASRIVDHDRPATLDTVRFLHALQQAHPDLTLVPAHDASVHDRLGYYPEWVR
ncbi:MBL fold metallo-hydrolase [Rhizobacter sp. LjRoot28]|uniref:MBL fold metallo-hydrolase n=1 Tax=Rhizobacter sp. LjRoot28 TaxID=3342309 RepID=UPI003ED05955